MHVVLPIVFNVWNTSYVIVATNVSRGGGCSGIDYALSRRTRRKSRYTETFRILRLCIGYITFFFSPF